MRILHVIRSLDPHCGGPPAVLRELVSRQVERGHRVTVLTTTRQAAGQVVECGFDEYRKAMTKDRAFQQTEIVFVRAFGNKKPMATFAFAPGCRRWLRRRFEDSTRAPDLVHIHEVFVHLNMAAAAEARRRSVPYVISPYGCLSDTCLRTGSSRLKQLFSLAVGRKMVGEAAFVQATSPSEMERFPAWIPRERVRLVPHGATVPDGDLAAAGERFRSQFPQVRGRRVMACLARIHPIKRMHLAIEALAKARLSNPKPLLVIAGKDAGDLANLKALVESLGLHGDVLFIGFVDQRMREDLLSAADLLLMPSRHENFGLAVVEALAHGAAAVVTPEVASHVYVDESGCGMTVEGTPDALAGAIQKVLEETSEAKRHQAREYVRQHLSWEVVVEQLDRLYDTAVR